MVNSIKNGVSNFCLQGFYAEFYGRYILTLFTCEHNLHRHLLPQLAAEAFLAILHPPTHPLVHRSVCPRNQRSKPQHFNTCNARWTEMYKKSTFSTEVVVTSVDGGL